MHDITARANNLDLAARQALSIITEPNFSAGSLNFSSYTKKELPIESPFQKSSRGIKRSSILPSPFLFSHILFEDLEYLLPPEDVVISGVNSLFTK
ncbi:hypothetical protein F5878DRAFT_23870 [Lentinula raphanica]|uniref:Uncharacterized protein n=1 Tax=Lentinula raphanica TaxID=153919 RepID=A0AA38PE77_9AGAR|nr:hypothetical protein F5880DRAFT_921255 [Lentinula raphanica]KAJ3841295.1 hypothetical protein F5878DRAFT_23870 [Lentinula raphanica]